MTYEDVKKLIDLQNGLGAFKNRAEVTYPIQPYYDEWAQGQGAAAPENAPQFIQYLEGIIADFEKQREGQYSPPPTEKARPGFSWGTFLTKPPFAPKK